jgi:hypothetical protein
MFPSESCNDGLSRPDDAFPGVVASKKSTRRKRPETDLSLPLGMTGEVLCRKWTHYPIFFTAWVVSRHQVSEERI